MLFIPQRIENINRMSDSTLKVEIVRKKLKLSLPWSHQEKSPFYEKEEYIVRIDGHQ